MCSRGVHFSPDGTHAVAYDLAWRHIKAEPEASLAVKEQTGHKLKSALSYVFRHYTLDDLHYPTSGIGFRCACLANLNLCFEGCRCCSGAAVVFYFLERVPWCLAGLQSCLKHALCCATVLV